MATSTDNHLLDRQEETVTGHCRREPFAGFATAAGRVICRVSGGSEQKQTLYWVIDSVRRTPFESAAEPGRGIPSAEA